MYGEKGLENKKGPWQCLKSFRWLSRVGMMYCYWHCPMKLWDFLMCPLYCTVDAWPWNCLKWPQDCMNCPSAVVANWICLCAWPLYLCLTTYSISYSFCQISHNFQQFPKFGFFQINYWKNHFLLNVLRYTLQSSIPYMWFMRLFLQVFVSQDSKFQIFRIPN